MNANPTLLIVGRPKCSTVASLVRSVRITYENELASSVVKSPRKAGPMGFSSLPWLPGGGAQLRPPGPRGCVCWPLQFADHTFSEYGLLYTCMYPYPCTYFEPHPHPSFGEFWIPPRSCLLACTAAARHHSNSLFWPPFT